MSAETMSRLEDAIREHLADEGQGGITTAWVVVSNSTDGGEGDEGSVWIEDMPHQQRFVTMGLLESGAVMTRGFVYAAMIRSELDEEDDDG
jgi:hypothetical protein